MWDACGMYISHDVGCMWDFYESENFQYYINRYWIPFCKCGMNVGFLKKVNLGFTFWYRNLDMSKSCIGWLVGEVDGAAASHRF